ncbi:unnamed protein product, partial [Rotaria magnacalcarata]
RDIKIPSIQTSAENITPRSEIEEFEDNICQQKIEIVPIFADRFQEHLENLELKQKSLTELNNDPNSKLNQQCKAILEKLPTQHCYEDGYIDPKKIPWDTLLFQGHYAVTPETNKMGDIMSKEDIQEIHTFFKDNDLDFLKLPKIFQKACLQINPPPHVNNFTKVEETIPKAINLRAKPIHIGYSLLKKIKFIDGANSFKLRNNIDETDTNCQVFRYANQIEAVPDLEFLKQGNKLWDVIEELEETKESIVWHRPYDNKILPVVSDDFMINVLITAHKDAHK